MRLYEDLVKEKIINENKVISGTYVASFYREQLEKFEKLGLGKKTENGVTITQNLIDITEKRFYELRPLRRKR